jgi:hypothetical protein
MLCDNPDGFQLDADGYAIPQADLLHDFLVEHPDDPDEGDPADWPAWTDTGFWCLGPDPDPDPLPGEEAPLSEPPADWPLTGPEDLEDLRHWERQLTESFEPDQADIEAMLDQAERREYERGCNARFV